MGGGGGTAAICDQRAELRALQDLRYQGPQPQHHMGAARGRRRAEIFKHVKGVPRPGHDTATTRYSWYRTLAVRSLSLRGGGKKAILRPTRRAGRTPPMEAANRDCSYSVPAPDGRRARRSAPALAALACRRRRGSRQPAGVQLRADDAGAVAADGIG